MRKIVRSVPLPLMAALLLLGAGWRVSEVGTHDTFSTSLVTAGMIIIGAWLREYVPINIKPSDEHDDVPG